MKEIVERGATGVILHLFLPDSGSVSGAGRTGVSPSSSGLVIALIRPGDPGPAAYSASAGTIESIVTLGTWISPTEGRCRWREIDAGLLPGWYELQLPNAWFDATGDRRSVAGMVWGPAGVVPTPFQIQLCDPARGVGSPSRLDAAISSRADAAAYTSVRAQRLDLLDTPISSRGDATAATQATLLSRLGPFSGGTLNSVFGFLRAALRKDAGLTPGDVQGSFDNVTDSLEARAEAAVSQQGEVLDRLGPFSGGTLNSVFGFLRAALRKDVGLTPGDVHGSFDNATDSLEALAQPGPALSLPEGERLAIAHALLDLVDGVETGETPRETLRLLRAVCVGKSTGFPNGPVAFRDRADSKNRVVATVDGDGNRQAIATDAT